MNTWLQITAGRGPTECCYVVSRIAGCIRRDAGKLGLQTNILELIPGPTKNTALSILISIDGEQAGFFAQSWQGTIQWIGQSPFRPRHKRKNWFVGVALLTPFVPPDWPKNVFKVEALRSSGPGGQHANKTESAVRVTHEPSGVSAVAQEERSQHRNRQLAVARVLEQLQTMQAQAVKDDQQERWTHHNQLERGNAVRIFVGPDFKERAG